MTKDGKLEEADYQTPLYGACLIATNASDSSDVSRPSVVLDRTEQLYRMILARGGAQTTQG